MRTFQIKLPIIHFNNELCRTDKPPEGSTVSTSHRRKKIFSIDLMHNASRCILFHQQHG